MARGMRYGTNHQSGPLAGPPWSFHVGARYRMVAGPAQGPEIVQVVRSAVAPAEDVIDLGCRRPA